ncbi:NUDIX domain-containing protein [Candidatus Latescibacterota bacterium]
MKPELPEYNFCPKCGTPVELHKMEGRIRPVCTSCGNVIYVNPVPATAQVVLDERRVLLVLRAVEPHRGEWCLPGGFLEWGESPENGTRRELFEETGIDADKLSLIGVYDSYTGPQRHVLLVAYRVISWRGEPVPGDDASDVQWFDFDEIPPLAFSVHNKVLAEALSVKGGER